MIFIQTIRCYHSCVNHVGEGSERGISYRYTETPCVFASRLPLAEALSHIEAFRSRYKSWDKEKFKLSGVYSCPDVDTKLLEKFDVILIEARVAELRESQSYE